MAQCPNCSARGFNPKEDCIQCGYKEVETTREIPYYLFFCSQCACSYSKETMSCPSHGEGEHISKL
jgi:hypothetical protein